MQTRRAHYLPEVIIVKPRVVEDERGSFLESYNKKSYQAAGIHEDFVQDNHSWSRHGVLRGLHYQHPNPQGRLVRVVEGEVLDVVVDVRLGSPTFRTWLAIRLSGTNRTQLYVPPDYAHGFLVLSAGAHFEYKVTRYWDRSSEHSVLWNDPSVGIEWPIDSPLLSDKDAAGLRVEELRRSEQLPEYQS